MKELLSHAGAAFTAKNVDEDDKAYDELMALKFRTVPVTVIGDRVIAGGGIFTVREMTGRRIESLSVDLHSLGDRRATDREPQSTHTEA